MQLLTKTIRLQLEANFKNPDDDHKPVVKLFNPVGSATWLLTEIEPDSDLAFGLCDLGMGSPELGSVSISELEGIRLPLGLGIERDLHFTADKTISQYAEAARANGYLEA
jgi:hypothetical protein